MSHNTLRNYKFRLYPNQEQTRKLSSWLDTCRFIYNTALAQRKEAWEKEKRSVTRVEQQVWLKKTKKEKDQPCLRQVHSQVAQEVLFRVERAFQGFFRRVKNGETPGYPRFKGKGRYHSLTYTQFGEGRGASFANHKLKLSKIGLVKIKLHRGIPGKVKTVTISREADGNWYAVFSVEMELEPQVHPAPQVGLDVGIEKFATLSDGTTVENPRHLSKTEKRIKHRPKNLSRKQKGSGNRKQARKKLARQHTKIRNQRRDFLHQQSRKLTRSYSLIAVEGLNVRGLVKNRHLARSISDAAWSEFLRLLGYKAEEAGGRVVRVNPRDTSQECSHCGQRVAKDLSVRIHDCPHCGLRQDRDINAARNILQRALALEVA